jgi:hypothetical protein
MGGGTSMLSVVDVDWKQGEKEMGSVEEINDENGTNERMAQYTRLCNALEDGQGKERQMRVRRE